MPPLPLPFILLAPLFHLILQNYTDSPPQKKKTGLPAPKPGRNNFPKRHSAVSLGKLEEGWNGDKGKGMRPGKAAAEGKDSSDVWSGDAELRLFRRLFSPPF